MTALQVDPFSRRLRGNQDLYITVLELLFCVKPCSGLISEAGFHASMNEADLESPVFQSGDEVVKSIFEFGEKEKSLLGVVKEALSLKEVLQL